MVKKAAHATPNQLLLAARKERGWTQQQVADRIGAPLSLNVSRWENGTAFPSAYYIERLCQLFGKSVRELGLSQLEGETQDEQASRLAPPLEQNRSWADPKTDKQDRVHPQTDLRMGTLPSPRNLFFLGREDVLAHLRRQLQAAQTMALSQPQALCGLGGVGKTQVALEYAYRHAQDYQAIFWTRADSHDALVAGFLEIAQAVQLPERDARDQSVVVTAVKAWLSQLTGWLLILDNADELVLLPEFLPVPIMGHLLLTTRAQALGGLASRIEIEPLDQETAPLLLLRRAGLLALDAPLAEAEQTDRQVVGQLALELGGLPLALDQAGAYLEETGCGLQQYLDLYRSHRADLLRQRGGVVQDHPDSVATTWSLSFALVEQRSAAAADLLRLCAVLHPDALPEELILQGSAFLGPALAGLETDHLAFNRALSVIQSYSLLRRTSRERTLSMHRLVQAVLQDAMTAEARDLWTERALAALNAVFPEVRHQIWGQWEPCVRLLPHVLTVVASTAIQERNLELASLLAKAADYLLQRAQYEQAESLFLRALHIREQMLSQEHPEVAFPLDGLADLYREQGRYEEAESLFLRAVHICEQALGQEHPEVALSLNRLGLLYWNQGKYEQAEPLFLRALHFWEQQFGPEHSKLACPLNNLAILYGEQGYYEQAEPLFLRALRLNEQTLGPEHPEVANPLNNLAELYRIQGRYEEAEPLIQRALSIWEQTLGHEHPRVAFSLDELANLYREQGYYEQAEPLYQRALSIWEQTLGHEHPQVAFPLNGLANLYREQGYYEQAELFYQRALSIRQQQLGDQHPETAESLHDFARLYEPLNQPDQALALYQQALAIRERRLGPEHLRTLDTRTRYAHLLRACGRTEEAAALERASTGQASTSDQEPLRLQL